MEQLHNEWPIKNGAEKEVESETASLTNEVHTWCLAAAAAAAAGFILDDEEGIVAILESHAIAREEGDPQPRSTATDDRPG